MTRGSFLQAFCNFFAQVKNKKSTINSFKLNFFFVIIAIIIHRFGNFSLCKLFHLLDEHSFLCILLYKIFAQNFHPSDCCFSCLSFANSPEDYLQCMLFCYCWRKLIVHFIFCLFAAFLSKHLRNFLFFLIAKVSDGEWNICSKWRFLQIA